MIDDEFFLKPGTVIGYRRDGRPIYAIGGAAPDDDGNDSGSDGGNDDGGDNDSDDNDDDDGESLDKENAELKAEVAGLRKALKAARQDARSNKTKGNDETVSKLERQLAEMNALETLRDEGAKGPKRRLQRALRGLDSLAPEDLKVGIAELREDWPELFTEDGDGEDKGKPTRRVPRSKSRSDGDNKGSKSKPTISKTSQLMLGRIKSLDDDVE